MLMPNPYTSYITDADKPHFCRMLIISSGNGILNLSRYCLYILLVFNSSKPVAVNCSRYRHIGNNEK